MRVKYLQRLQTEAILGISLQRTVHPAIANEEALLLSCWSQEVLVRYS